MTNARTPHTLLHAAYSDALREHAVKLICMGHQRLDVSVLSRSEEDDITGELVRAIKHRVCCDPSAPDWVDHYEVHEQVRQNDGGRRGKRRPMMDVEIECHFRGPRPRLGFEAKRLGHGYTAAKYLGVEGMTAFLNNYYQTTHGDAGMIGYVQQGTAASWAEQILEEIRSDRETYYLSSDSVADISDGIKRRGFRTDHRDSQECPLAVLHLFLQFCNPDVEA
ncbi:MAG: hypothetical protein KDB01_08580 [Planctomycetaceae bacterium]|nr:hypothetical protein [Planctomycetaceae bacterium]